jgi:uncharacterized protein YeaO (DUF488 family)
MIRLKRIYETASNQDGKRLLVERLWPRGVKKTLARLDGWLKEVAPSPALRSWFSHDPAKWNTFRRRYYIELDGKPEAWDPIMGAARHGRVTLIFSSRDIEHNNAVALKQYLDRKMKKSVASSIERSFSEAA